MCQLNVFRLINLLKGLYLSRGPGFEQVFFLVIIVYNSLVLFYNNIINDDNQGKQLVSLCCRSQNGCIFLFYLFYGVCIVWGVMDISYYFDCKRCRLYILNTIFTMDVYVT